MCRLVAIHVTAFCASSKQGDGCSALIAGFVMCRVVPPRDPQVVVHVGNMWWNPRLSGAPYAGSDAGDNSSRGGGLPNFAGGTWLRALAVSPPWD
jgi:hypothetical protein